MAPAAVDPILQDDREMGVQTPTATDLANRDIIQNLKQNVFKPKQDPSVPSIAHLDASKLVVSLKPEAIVDTKPVEAKARRATDHMISCKWTAAEGWEVPHLMPYAPLQMEPSTACLHYAIQCFEGLKLYRGVDGRLRLFRPRLNAERLCRSSARGGMPTFDPAEVEKLIIALCRTEGPRFLPRRAPSADTVDADNIDRSLLYIRPMMIGTDESVGIAPPTSARLIVFMCPFPAMDRYYLARPGRGLRLLASRTNEVRAWPGGFGGAKLGANYGPSLVAQREAARLGYDQVLWLYSYPDPLEDDPTGCSGGFANGDTKRKDGLVTEAGASNFFVVWTTPDGRALEIVTAPLTGGIILAGITRRSALELAAERLAAEFAAAGDHTEIRVSERWFTLAEVADAQREGRLREAFAVGTAYFVTPVSHINWRGQDIEVPNGGEAGAGPVAGRLHKWMKDIMYGIEHHEWAVIVPEADA